MKQVSKRLLNEEKFNFVINEPQLDMKNIFGSKKFDSKLSSPRKYQKNLHMEWKILDLVREIM